MSLFQREPIPLAVMGQDSNMSSSCNSFVLSIDPILCSEEDPPIVMPPANKPLKSEGKRTCELCLKLFSCGSALYRHMRNCHPVYSSKMKERQIEECKFHCDKCGKLFKSNKSIVQHNRRNHGGPPPKKIYQPNYVCPTCGKGFGRKSSVRVHAKQCHQYEEYSMLFKCSKKCSECDTKFSSSVAFLQHLPVTHGITPQTDIYLVNTKEDFDRWKEDIEKETVSQYVKKSVFKSDGGIRHISYKCHRNGTFRSRSKGIRKMKSCKIDGFCPASMTVKPTTTGDIFPAEVKFVSTHFNHECEASKIRGKKLKNEADTKNIVKSFVGKLSQEFSEGEQCDEIDKAIKMLMALKKKKEKNGNGEKSTPKKVSKSLNLNSVL